DDDDTSDSLQLSELFILAIATSIDALAVGIAFAMLNNGINIFFSVAVIGLITFILSVIGVAVGNKFGSVYKNKAELTGGIILILLGLKILLEHLGLLRSWF
ncbi:MAG: manganese efflux pump, partial [Clostridia bacterium]|nr:manganese efflux pump [Clostridia bacterium]